MSYPQNPHIFPSAPRTGNRLTRWMGRTLLGLMGWKLIGTFPDVKKMIVVGAPHTSNWDLFLALGTMMALSAKFSWIMKKEAFFWPVAGIWRALGGIPIDRKAKTDIIEQMKAQFDGNEKLWLGITPEGTRSKVENYKKGYLRMAYGANVPLFIVGVNAKKKELILDGIYPLSGDIDTDNQAIQAHIRKTFNGIKPELGLDERPP